MPTRHILVAAGCPDVRARPRMNQTSVIGLVAEIHYESPSAKACCMTGIASS